MTFPIISGRVDISCPNFINDGPSLLSACAIRIPSEEFLYSFDFVFPPRHLREPQRQEEHPPRAPVGNNVNSHYYQSSSNYNNNLRNHQLPLYISRPTILNINIIALILLSIIVAILPSQAPRCQDELPRGHSKASGQS